MKTITIKGEKYIVRKTKKRDACKRCVLAGKCLEMDFKCISLSGLDGYFVKDTSVNRLKDLLEL